MHTHKLHLCSWEHMHKCIHIHTWCCDSSRFPLAQRDRPRRWHIFASSSLRPNCSARRRPRETDSRRDQTLVPRGWYENHLFQSPGTLTLVTTVAVLKWILTDSASSTHICHSFSPTVSFVFLNPCFFMQLIQIQFKSLETFSFISDMFHLLLLRRRRQS